MTRPKSPSLYAIDFGTSNSLCAATDGETLWPPIPLDPAAPDATVFRTLLYFPNSQACFYGQNAIEQYVENSGQGRLVRSIKKYLPTKSFSGSWIDDRLVRLEDLIGFFLLEIRRRANAHFQTDVTALMLGRPARFSFDAEEDKLAQYRLQKAAEIAGFTRIEFLPEPIAAAFDLKKRMARRQTVLVVDLGGGTSDFTVLEIGPEPFKESDIKAIGGVSVAGDRIDGEFMKVEIAPHLGSEVRYKVPLGRNILTMPPSLLDHICSPADITQLSGHEFFHFFREVQRWALGEDDRARMQRLIVLVEDRLGFRIFESIDQVKRQLSEASVGRFEFAYPGAEIRHDITRERYESVITPPVTRILDELDETLTAAGCSPEQIDLVYCTGGTSKLPLIRSALIRRFGAEKIQSQDHFHSVTRGLAERARQILNQ